MSSWQKKHASTRLQQQIIGRLMHLRRHKTRKTHPTPNKTPSIHRSLNINHQESSSRASTSVETGWTHELQIPLTLHITAACSTSTNKQSKPIMPQSAAAVPAAFNLAAETRIATMSTCHSRTQQARTTLQRFVPSAAPPYRSEIEKTKTSRATTTVLS